MSTVKFDTWQNTDGTENYKCRAWVKFDGTYYNAMAVYASGNVSSVTDNGTGDYTVTFTSAMPDTHYTITAGVQEDVSSVNNPTNRVVAPRRSTSSITTSSVRVSAANYEYTATDVHFVYVVIHR